MLTIILKIIPAYLFLKRVILVISLTTFFISCTAKKPVIGFMLPHTTMKRYVIEKEVFTNKIQELGGTVIFRDAGNDEDKQVQQFNEIIDSVDIMVLDPVNRFNAAQMVRKAHEKGKKVISYDRLISNAVVDAFVTFDPELIGKQMTEYVLKLKPTGNYLILGGDNSDLNAIGIDIGQQKALKEPIKNGQVKVLYRSFLEKWAPEDARFELNQFIRLTGIVPDVVLAAADGVSKGVVEALIDNKLEGKVLVTGNGGEVFTCKNMIKGYQTMTVYKPIKKLAIFSADLAIKMLKNENTKDLLNQKMNNGLIDVPSFLMEAIPINADGIKNTVLADGLVTEEELNR